MSRLTNGARFCCCCCDGDGDVDFLRDWIMNRGVSGGARNGGRAPSGGDGGDDDVYVEL
jgi:hypothetical protein